MEIIFSGMENLEWKSLEFYSVTAYWCLFTEHRPSENFTSHSLNFDGAMALEEQ